MTIVDDVVSKSNETAKECSYGQQMKKARKISIISQKGNYSVKNEIFTKENGLISSSNSKVGTAVFLSFFLS